MADILEKTNLMFDKLGVSRGADVEALFVQLKGLAQNEASSIHNLEDLEGFRIRWLSRKNGIATRVRDNWLKAATGESKKWVGSYFNWFARELDNIIDFEKNAITLLGQEDAIDLSLPGVMRPIGSEHLIRQTYDELFCIFGSIGFSVVEGPEIESSYYNFEALNIPEHHPARDNMDTFYIANAPGYLLRTHTSPMQARTMEQQQPPVRIVVPGKVYRRDNPDATHSFMFHQLEGLAVDTDITFCEFKGTIEYFAKEFFGPQTQVRLRPSYFPFTEPSAEFDASCHVCGGKGCRTCKQSGWIEMFGAGMVDPAVYGFVNYDPKKYTGFAFGLGVDRLAMLKYGIDDLQQFFRNDVRFLQQFP